MKIRIKKRGAAPQQQRTPLHGQARHSADPPLLQCTRFRTFRIETLENKELLQGDLLHRTILVNKNEVTV